MLYPMFNKLSIIHIDCQYMSAMLYPLPSPFQYLYYAYKLAWSTKEILNIFSTGSVFDKFEGNKLLVPGRCYNRDYCKFVASNSPALHSCIIPTNFKGTPH